jgi:hypothetical protein
MRIFHQLFAGRRPALAIGLLTGAAAITLAALPAAAIPTPAATPTPAVTVYTTADGGSSPYAALELTGPKPGALRTTASLRGGYNSFLLDRPSGNIYLNGLGSMIEVLDSGLKHPAFAAPDNCSSYVSFFSHGMVAIGGADTSIYVPDCAPKTQVPMLYGYRIGTRTPIFAAAAPHPGDQAIYGAAVDGSGLLWGAWNAGCCGYGPNELVAYAPPSTKPIIAIDLGVTIADLVVDRTGALWELQYGSGSSNQTANFLHGTCTIDTHVPSKPTDDLRAVLARKIVKGKTVGLLYTSPNGINGDFDHMYSLAAGSDGHAYVSWDTGIDVYSSQTGVVCPSAKMSVPETLAAPFLDTDAAGNLYVGLRSAEKGHAPILDVFKPGGTALIASYPNAYSSVYVPGSVWVR